MWDLDAYDLNFGKFAATWRYATYNLLCASPTPAEIGGAEFIDSSLMGLGADAATASRRSRDASALATWSIWRAQASFGR